MRKQTRRSIMVLSGITALGLLAGAFLTNADQGDPPAAKAPQAAAASGTAQPQAAAKATDKTILFFMNPNGRPCQMQDAILQQMRDTLKALAGIHYYKTTVGADLDAFGKYGIRSLPSLIVIDAKGKEIKRFTPGIQDRNAVLQGLSGKKN